MRYILFFAVLLLSSCTKEVTVQKNYEPISKYFVCAYCDKQIDIYYHKPLKDCKLKYVGLGQEFKENLEVTGKCYAMHDRCFKQFIKSKRGDK